MEYAILFMFTYKNKLGYIIFICNKYDKEVINFLNKKIKWISESFFNKEFFIRCDY